MISINLNEIAGWGSAILGMRNPMNSWDKSDSAYWDVYYKENSTEFIIGPNDLKLARKLALAGTDHAKYRRMIVVWANIKAPLYWWKEADTYKVGTVANSCSTMHKIADKKFTLEDFSCEKLIDDEELGTVYADKESYDYDTTPAWIFDDLIKVLNDCRDRYLETKDKKYWWQMIQLLPSSYNQTRTVMLSYEVLANIYKSRRNHKLDEWREFCKWIEELPYAKDIIFPWKDEKEKDT